MANYTLWYMIQLTEHERNHLTIDEKGNVTVYIQESRMGSSPRALGYYSQTVGHDDSDLIKIGQLIHQESLVGGEVSTMPPVSGMRSKIFSIKEDGKEATHLLNARQPSPLRFSEVEQVILRLFNRLEGDPLRTFSMDISFLPREIIPAENLQINFEFRNTGKYATDFRNPANFKVGSPSYLRLDFWRHQMNEQGKQELEYEWTLDLAGREFLVESRKSLPSSDPLLHIKPGGTLRAWTVVRFPKIQPDTYSIEAIYYGNKMVRDEQEKQNDLLVGKFHADLNKLIVSKP